MIKDKVQGKKIVVGMSGGVDSSMALVLLKRQGWRPIGISLRYAVWQDEKNLLRENVCCSAESFEIAKRVCEKLNVPHRIFDVSKEFKKEVIDYFISELKNSRTPNPCIICNRRLKFKKLFDWAKEHNIKYVATGHYARAEKNAKTGKYELLNAKDNKKDQTYSLCLLPQKWLKNIVFPLGGLSKKEIYQMAEKEDFKFFLKIKQSQDFCFVADKCLNCFLEKEIGLRPGPIKDIKNNILGGHQGLHFYTIGQRKGIDLSQGPYFVAGKNSKTNTLTVSKNKQELLSNQAFLSSYHFISGKKLEKNLRVGVKIRSQHIPAKALLIPIGSRRIKIVFDRPQKSITPGQFAVFYKNGVCLGGGKLQKQPVKQNCFRTAVTETIIENSSR